MVCVCRHPARHRSVKIIAALSRNNLHRAGSVRATGSSPGGRLVDNLGGVSEEGPIQSISAVTLLVADMARSVGFYQALGFEVLYGGPEASFTSLRVGDQFLNLMADDGFRQTDLWGRIIIYVDDVDRQHRRAIEAGLTPEAPPRDADWGERYFHLDDPDGHQLSFARPL